MIDRVFLQWQLKF